MNIKTNQNSGVVLVTVICFTAVVAMLAIGLIAESSTHLKLAGKQADLEQAFFAAEAGTEQAVHYIAAGYTVPGTVTGVVGNGRYSTSIISTGSSTNSGTNTVTGAININPNGSPDNEFLLMKPDGSWITRDDLTGDTTVYDSAPCVYYTGSAILIHVKPKGGASQYGLTINGTTYELENNTTYDFSSFSMTVQVFNDSRNPGNGRANGQWWVGNIDASGVTICEGGAVQGLENYSIFSIGTMNNVRRAVLLDGVHQQSWAKYAMWYDHSAGSIYFIGGEVMTGPVYSRVQIYLQDNPIFKAPLLCSAASWGQWSDAAVFEQGYQLSAPAQTMASVNFSNLLGVAGMVMTGLTSITLSQTNMVVTNPRSAWTNVTTAFPSNGLVYVQLATSGSSTAAIVNIGGTNLDGRLTIVSDQDIRITNHLRYAVHPTNGSDDALGLIAKRDVIVWTNAPANLDVYAHIIAYDTRTNYNAGFYVTNYSTRPYSQALNVYGGIVENNRGAVGTTTPKGYFKNYIFDTRFENNPPPMYPALTNEYVWSRWRDKGL